MLWARAQRITNTPVVTLESASHEFRWTLGLGPKSGAPLADWAFAARIGRNDLIDLEPGKTVPSTSPQNNGGRRFQPGRVGVAWQNSETDFCWWIMMLLDAFRWIWIGVFFPIQQDGAHFGTVLLAMIHGYLWFSLSLCKTKKPGWFQPVLANTPLFTQATPPPPTLLRCTLKGGRDSRDWKASPWAIFCLKKSGM